MYMEDRTEFCNPEQNPVYYFACCIVFYKLLHSALM